MFKSHSKCSIPALRQNLENKVTIFIKKFVNHYLRHTKLSMLKFYSESDFWLCFCIFLTDHFLSI